MRGFTLIEVLVVIMLFGISITAFFGLFSSAFRYQQKSLGKISLLNNASYITEYMSRALRLAKKDKPNGNCIGLNRNYATTSNSITFLNFHDQCQQFYLDGQTLKVAKSENDLPNFTGRSMALTPSNIKVSNLKFYVTGEPQPPADKNQPRVTIVLKLKKNGQVLPLQTTITQRQLDVKY